MVPFLDTVPDTIERIGLPGDLARRLARRDMPALRDALLNRDITVLGGHDLSRIPPILAQHPKSPRVSEISDPANNSGADASNTFVVILQREGRDVGCACVRLKWIERSLKDAYESQSLFFDEATPSTVPLEALRQTLICTHEIAEYQIRSAYLAVSNGFCVLPDAAENKAVREVLLRCLMRLVHFSSLRWPWSWLIAHAQDWIAAKHAFDTDGFDTVMNGLTRIEGASQTHYRLMATSRMSFVRLIAHPSYGNPSLPLGIPALIGGAG